MVDDERLEEDEELEEDKEEELVEDEEEELEDEEEGSLLGSSFPMYVLVVTIFAWLDLSVSLSIGWEISLTSSSESWCVIEDGGEWNSARFRCGYVGLGSLNSRVVDLAFLLDLCVCFCSHKVALSSAFLQR